MTQDLDEQIATLLRQSGPGARDHLFRLKVLELRERRRFRLRVSLMLAGALAVTLISALGLSVGGETYETARATLCGVALALTGFIYAPVLMRVLQRSFI